MPSSSVVPEGVSLPGPGSAPLASFLFEYLSKTLRLVVHLEPLGIRKAVYLWGCDSVYPKTILNYEDHLGSPPRATAGTQALENGELSLDRNREGH